MTMCVFVNYLSSEPMGLRPDCFKAGEETRMKKAWKRAVAMTTAFILLVSGCSGKEDDSRGKGETGAEAGEKREDVIVVMGPSSEPEEGFARR